MSNTELEPLLTAQEIADVLKVSDETVYAMFRTGELPAMRVRRQWRCQQSSFKRWMANQEQQPPTDGDTVRLPTMLQ